MIQNCCKLFVATCLVIAAPLGAHAQNIIPPKTFTTSPTGINLADATYTYSVTDLAIGTLKLDRFLIGSYLPDPNTMFFGTHTSHNFDIYVSRNTVGQNDYRSIVHLGTSASGTYYEGSSGAISPGNRDAESGTLAKVSGNYVHTDSSGTVYRFTSSVQALGTNSFSQRVASITLPDGRVQTFSYVSGQLKLVSDSSGYAIVFDYAANGRVSAACGFNLSRTYVTASTTCSGATLKTSYGYDDSNNLISATDVMGQTTSYGWGMVGLTCVTPPGYSTCKIANTYSGIQVSQQTLADGSVWKFGANLGAGETTDEGAEYPDGSNGSGYVDPNGKTIAVNFTKSTPYSMTDANGNTTQYRFIGARDYHSVSSMYRSEGSLLTEVTFPEGNKYVAAYDGSNNITRQAMQAKPGSGLPDQEVTFGYNYFGTPQNTHKPVWKKDSKGNQTDFTYATWGGTLSEMQPAPSVGEARPLKLYAYVQSYAYVKNSGGALVTSGAPIWLPSTETLCQTYAGSSTASCDPAAPITVTSYEYGASGTADNLLLRGLVVSSGGISLRTCYGYDEYGNKIFETKPRAGLASCS